MQNIIAGLIAAVVFAVLFSVAEVLKRVLKPAVTHVRHVFLLCAEALKGSRGRPWAPLGAQTGQLLDVVDDDDAPNSRRPSSASPSPCQKLIAGSPKIWGMSVFHSHMIGRPANKRRRDG